MRGRPAHCTALELACLHSVSCDSAARFPAAAVLSRQYAHWRTATIACRRCFVGVGAWSACLREAPGRCFVGSLYDRLVTVFSAAWEAAKEGLAAPPRVRVSVSKRNRRVAGVIVSWPLAAHVDCLSVLCKANRDGGRGCGFGCWVVSQQSGTQDFSRCVLLALWWRLRLLLAASA